MQSTEPEGEISTTETKEVTDQERECDFKSFFFKSIIDIFYDDLNVSLSNLFNTDNVFFSKVNAINSDFVYLCDVFPNDYYVCDDHFMHIFDINSVQTESFNLGTCDNPKNILIASNLNLDKRIKMEEILRKRYKVFAWGYEDMPGIDREIEEYIIPTYSHITPIKKKRGN